MMRLGDSILLEMILASSIPRSGILPMATSNSPDWTQIVTAGIAFVALIGAFLQLQSTRHATRRRNAFAYFERWSSPASLPFIVKMNALFAEGQSKHEDDERWRLWNGMPYEDRIASLLFVNFWEELGGLYNRKLVDQEIIREYFGPAIVEYWKTAQWFVKRSRAEDGEAVFSQWQAMRDDIEPRLRPSSADHSCKRSAE